MIPAPVDRDKLELFAIARLAGFRVNTRRTHLLFTSSPILRFYAGDFEEVAVKTQEYVYRSTKKWLSVHFGYNDKYDVLVVRESPVQSFKRVS